jgi:ribosome-associated protein
MFPPGNTLDPPPQSGRQRCSGDIWIEKQEAAIARKPTPAKESPKRRVAAEPKPKAATKAKASAKPKAAAEPKAKAAPKIAASKAAAAKPAAKPAAKASKAAPKTAAAAPAPKRAAAKAVVAKPAPKPAAKVSKPAPKRAASKAAVAKSAPKPAAKASKAAPKTAAAAPAPKRAAAKATTAKPAPKPAAKASKAVPRTATAAPARKPAAKASKAVPKAKAEPKAKPATKVTAPRPARGRRREKIAPDRLEMLVEAARQSLEDDKAENIVVLDVTGRADYTDRLIIATGQVERQLQAMATHLDEALGKAGLHIKRDAIQASGDWVLIDAGDLVIHLFRPDARELYRLERMWGPESPLTTEASDAAHE